MAVAEYAERSPQTLQTLARDLSSAGERDALVSFYKGEISRTSFRDLGAQVEHRARMLMSKGIGASDPVVLCGPGGADWIIACLAILRCGACVVPVDNQFTAQTFEHVVKDCGARCSLVASSASKRFTASLESAGVEVLPLAGEFAHPVGQHFPRVNPRDRAILCYTSGTTGPPKGVPLTHQNIAFQIDALANAGVVTVGDRVLLPLPLHHVYPLVIGMLTALAIGLTLILPDGFTGPRILAALREGEATLIIGVPRLYQALVEGITNQIRRHGSVATLGFRILLGFSRLVRRLFGWQIGKVLFAPVHRHFAPSLEKVVSGGAALKPEIARTLEAQPFWTAGGPPAPPSLRSGSYRRKRKQDHRSRKNSDSASSLASGALAKPLQRVPRRNCLFAQLFYGSAARKIIEIAGRKLRDPGRRRALVELADEVQQELTAGLSERSTRRDGRSLRDIVRARSTAA